MRIRTAKSAAELLPIEDKIRNLANDVDSPNVFYESWLLFPALEFLSRGDVLIVLIWDTGGERLAGILPLEIKTGYRRLPITYYSLWRHLHCFLCAPLIRRGREEETLRAFLAWLDEQDSGGLLFMFDQIAAVDPLFAQIKRVADKNGLKLDMVNTYQRPMLRTKVEPAAYLAMSNSPKHVKNFYKKFRALEKLGKLECQHQISQEQLPEWTQRFLEIEASGWKGKAGTAMLQSREQTLFFQAAVQGALSQEKLCPLSLTLDGRPIAMRCGFRTGDGAFSFKITFDEEYAKFSPGVLLEIEHLKYFQHHPHIKWVDSCAAPGVTLLDRLWNERRQITSLAVSSDKMLSRFLVSTLAGLKRARSIISPSKIPPSADVSDQL